MARRLGTIRLHDLPSWILHGLDARGGPGLYGSLVAALLAWGVAARLAGYLGDRSLWRDEAALALNLLHRSYPALTLPLDHNQGAPLGFLFAAKLAVSLFGEGERALRLLPLLSGLAALFLFYPVARLFLERRAALIALALFAIARDPVYYASEFKQYATDLLAALVLIRLMHPREFRALSPTAAAGRGLAAAALLWFSHPAALMVAGMGGCEMAQGLWRRDRRAILRYGIFCGIALTSFLILYLGFVRHLHLRTGLLAYWSGKFMPFPPTTGEELLWYPKTFLNVFYLLTHTVSVSVAALLFLMGCLRWARTDREGILFLMAPVLVTLGASALRLYPFSGRLILFLVPCFILPTAAGAAELLERARRRGSSWGGRLAVAGAALAIALLLAPQAHQSGLDLLHPGGNEDIKAVLAYVAGHREPGDGLYVHPKAALAFAYYQARFGLSEERGWARHLGREEPSDPSPILSDTPGKRVWFVFSHLELEQAEEFLRRVVEPWAERQDAYLADMAAGYLYRLRP